MKSKPFLMAVFVKKEKILTFLEKLKNELNLTLNNVFIFKIEENSNEYLTTFKCDDRNLLGPIENSHVIHKKKKSFFSINALNKLIEKEKGKSKIDNKDYQINWDNHSNELILLTNNELNINKISKIEDKTFFFN